MTISRIAAVFAFTLFLTPIQSQAQTRVDWMGAYLNGSKVGWSLFAYSPTTPHPFPLTEALESIDPFSNDEGIKILSRMSLEVQAYGAPNRLSWEMVASLQQDLTLDEFQFELKGKDSQIAVRGKSESSGVSVSIRSASVETREWIECPSEKLYIAEALPMVFARRLNEGDPVDGVYSVLEPHQFTCSSWDISLGGEEVLDTPEGPISTYRIHQDIGGLTATLWIDREGRVQKEWAPISDELGYVSYLESSDQASDPAFIHADVASASGLTASPPPTPDLLYATSVRVPEIIRDSGRVSRMIIELWDFRLDQPIPEGEWQSNLARYRNETPTVERPLRLEIISPDPDDWSDSSLQVVETSPPHDRYLKSESLIQSDHPRIQALAHAVTAGIGSPWEKALAIYDWMVANIRTEFRITLPSAIEVLESKKGDCNEQSTLFAALGRAAGVPTKICTGLVYQADGFYYHAWNEVLVSGDPEVWVPIDPALRQTRVDATHIKFGEGGLSDQTYLNQLIGRIRARVVELDTHDSDPEPHKKFRNENSG